MKVRDKRYKKTDFKGHEINCPYPDCPCLPCYNCHDCGYYLGHNEHKKWIENFDCATRSNCGCPSQKPRPKHLFKNTKKFQNRKSGDIFNCTSYYLININSKPIYFGYSFTSEGDIIRTDLDF